MNTFRARGGNAAGERRNRRDPGRAGAGPRRRSRAARLVSADAPLAGRSIRRAAHLRRNLHRLSSHGPPLRLRSLEGRGPISSASARRSPAAFPSPRAWAGRKSWTPRGPNRPAKRSTPARSSAIRSAAGWRSNRSTCSKRNRGASGWKSWAAICEQGLRTAARQRRSAGAGCAASA